jgi:hypothetical protein
LPPPGQSLSGAGSFATFSVQPLRNFQCFGTLYSQFRTTSYWFYLFFPQICTSPASLSAGLAASQLSGVQHLRKFPLSSTLQPVFLNTYYWFFLFLAPQICLRWPVCQRDSQLHPSPASSTFGDSSVFQHLILCFLTHALGFPFLFRFVSAQPGFQRDLGLHHFPASSTCGISSVFQHFPLILCLSTHPHVFLT